MPDASYKNLLTYQYAVYVYDLNKEFLELFLRGAENMRQRQQMDQAARSSKQCLCEGATQRTSMKNYIKMIGISRGSYEELLEDYKDIARNRGIAVWDTAGLRRNRGLRVFIKDGQPTLPSPHLPPDLAEAVNIMIDLITRTGFLFDRQRQSLEEKFLREGGYTENLFRKRTESRRT